ncbi:MAG: hypothetical protein AAF570_24025, partial [Bacteroidota bacterium]
QILAPGQSQSQHSFCASNGRVTFLLSVALFCEAVTKYEDALDVLDKTRWTNRHNEAEHRSVRDIFDQRLFNNYVSSISGRGIRTLEESDFRSNQMLQYEHNLWSY